jgi:RND family efflux transporter MFP subunit
MKKIIYPLFVALLVTSCGDRKSELDSLQAAKVALKSDISELSKELREIEVLIKELDTSDVDRRKPVGVMTLKKGQFRSYVEINGVVESKETITLVAETSGKIKRIAVKEGSTVRRGQVLATLSNELISNQIKELKKSLELAEELFIKQERLHEQNVGTEIQYLEAKNKKESIEQSIKTAEIQRSKTIITSPINGKIDKIHLNTGEMATPGGPFARIVNTSDVYVSADVSESYFYKLKVGDEAFVRMLNGADIAINSSLTYKGNYINPGNRTFKVHVALDSKRPYPPNMIMGVKVVNEKLENVYSVPRLYIQNDSKGTFIYEVVSKEGKFFAKKLRVVIKESYNGKVVIESGNLKESTQVIMNNFKGVDEGSEVKVIK